MIRVQTPVMDLNRLFPGICGNNDRPYAPAPTTVRQNILQVHDQKRRGESVRFRCRRSQGRGGQVPFHRMTGPGIQNMPVASISGRKELLAHA